MSTMQQPPQDEISAIQATLALHSEDLERIKQWLPESPDSVRQAIEQQAAEFAAAHERIEGELNAVREKQEAQGGEIANIKETLAALVIRTDVVVARIDEVVDRTDMLVAHVAEVNARTDAMSRTLTETNSRVGNIAGTRYERRVARTVHRRLSRAIGLFQAQVLHTDWGETDSALLMALNQANAISDEEYEDLLDVDIIFAGQDAAGQRAYAVVEIGLTVSDIDINRAARRARTLATATGDQCAAIVVGSEIPDAERERATRTDVAVITVADPVD